MVNDVNVKNKLFFKKKHKKNYIHNLKIISSLLIKYFYFILNIYYHTDVPVKTDIHHCC